MIVNSQALEPAISKQSANTIQVKSISDNPASPFSLPSSPPDMPSYSRPPIATYSSILKSTGKGLQQPSFSHINHYPSGINCSNDSITALHKQPEQKPGHNRHLPVAIYVAGRSFMTIKEVKAILTASPIGIQSRHMQNISRIEQRMLEILVDRNHVERVKNRITNFSNYRIRTSFNPLSPDSFHWDESVRPESQGRILQRNFITRLADSVAATSLTSTRQDIMDWVKNRGLEQKLEAELLKHGIRLSPDAQTRHNHIPTHTYLPRTGEPYQDLVDLQNLQQEQKVRAKRYVKRKRSISSIESLQVDG